MLNEQATTNVTFAPSASATINGLLLDANAGDFTSADFGGSISAAPNSSSYAVVILGELSFPTSLVTGLSFSTGANIELGYGTFGSFTGPTISDFSTLPTITSSSGIVYTNTNNMQLLTRLDLASVVHGLERVGDMLSDWMQNGTGPFNSKLFFALQSLVGIDNFGQDFANAVAQILIAPPSSLEATPAAILQALQLDPSALTFAISVGSGSTAGQVLLNISFDWAKTLTETLPLAVDLATLANNASTSSTYKNLQGQTEFYSSGVINQFLLDLSTIASDPTNPVNINFSEVSQLAVNLNLVVAQQGVAIQPEAVIQNPASGSFFQTRYLLDGDSLSGNLPAGTGYLQLSDGSFGVDASGQLDGSTSVISISSPSDSFNYDSASQTITGSGTIGGYAIGPNDVGSDILINSLPTTPTDNNGLFQVTSYDPHTHIWILTQQTAIGAIGANARFYVETGVPGTLAGTGSLVIGGHTVVAGDVGKYVVINDQTNTSQNGTYSITSVSTAGGGSWTLSLAAVSNPTISYTTTAPITVSTTNSSDTSTFANLFYGLASGSSAQFSLQAPLIYDTAAATSFNPATLAVSYATTAPITVTTQTGTTLAGTGTLTIDGHNFVSGDAGDYVLINTQTDPTQNGIYTVTSVTTGTSGNWTLTRATVTQTRLQVQNGTVNKNLFFGYDTPTQFAQLIEPVTYTYSLAGMETLPYTVEVATTSNIAGTFAVGTILAPATLTGTAGVSLNNLSTPDGTLTLTGIDDNQELTVGSLVLLKNQTAQEQNGVYVVTALGGTDASGNLVSWVLTRADFADTTTELTGLRIDVATGYENIGTRWVQTNGNLSALDSSGNSVTFSNNVTLLYSSGGQALVAGDVGKYIQLTDQTTRPRTGSTPSRP